MLTKMYRSIRSVVAINVFQLLSHRPSHAHFKERVPMFMGRILVVPPLCKKKNKASLPRSAQAKLPTTNAAVFFSVSLFSRARETRSKCGPSHHSMDSVLRSSRFSRLSIFPSKLPWLEVVDSRSPEQHAN